MSDWQSISTIPRGKPDIQFLVFAKESGIYSIVEWYDDGKGGDTWLDGSMYIDGEQLEEMYSDWRDLPPGPKP